MSNTPSPTGRKVLTRTEAFQVANWYEKNKDRFAGITDTLIIEEAKQTFGLTLSQGHVNGIRSMLGIKKREARKTPTADIEALTALVNEQSTKILGLMTNVQALMDRVRKLEARPA